MPDYINIGVFSALYFVIVALCALVSNIIFGVAGNLLLPAFAALLAGPVFMLLNARVRAFGAITTMGVVLGLFLFVSGHFATSLITGIAFPLLGDLVARLGAYRNKAALLGGYVLFSFGCAGPILVQGGEHADVDVVGHGKAAFGVLRGGQCGLLGHALRSVSVGQPGTRQLGFARREKTGMRKIDVCMMDVSCVGA